TSLLVRLLNLHPNVFVTHESDVIWLLYCLGSGRPATRYPWDGEVGLVATIRSCGDLLAESMDGARPLNVSGAFRAIQARLMSIERPAKCAERLLWLGDK